ncbi:MAG: type II toxin-antitoxin system HipA family toxin [Lautropia sp.]|nr:type II toxin-antitoxin system HipA family toxin [Lautropia sp.]
MKKIFVHYCGWGEDWLLGELLDDGHDILFSWSAQALARGMMLSPLRLKLGAGVMGGFPAHQHHLPGLVADSLPDGWGLLLMDRLFRQQGVRHPGPLDRLAFIGDRGMGALRFVPDTAADTPIPDWSLLALAEESARTLRGEADAALRELGTLGGSPQGARPKALVWYNPDSRRISTVPEASAQPWLVKFPAQGEHKEVCALEQLYMLLARRCGLEVPDSQVFDLSPRLSAFGTARFDREDGLRVPIHSLAGLLHIDFRLPGSADYTSFLRATRALCRSEHEVERAYERTVFNVLFHNRDDHPKNVAWRLSSDGHWHLAPAFDLTFSEGPRGQHHMDVCGEASQVTRDHLLQLAAESSIPRQRAEAIIDRMLTQADSLMALAQDLPIRKATIRRLMKTVQHCCQLAAGA